MTTSPLDGRRARLIKELAAAYAESAWNPAREGCIARIWRDLKDAQAQLDALALRGADSVPARSKPAVRSAA